MHTDEQNEIVLNIFEYREALLTYAYTMLRDWALAEDALQEALLVVLKRRDDAEPIRNLYAWTRRIVRNKSFEILRSRRRETTSEQERLWQLIAKACEKHLDERSAEEMKHTKRALHDCMSQLSESTVELLAGFYWKMKSCKELARIHRRSVNAIKLALSRSRARLRSCIELRLAETDIV